MRGQVYSSEQGRPSLRFCPIDGHVFGFDWDKDPYGVYSEEYSCSFCGFKFSRDFGGANSAQLTTAVRAYFEGLTDKQKEDLREKLRKERKAVAEVKLTPKRLEKEKKKLKRSIEKSIKQLKRELTNLDDLVLENIQKENTSTKAKRERYDDSALFGGFI